MPVQWRTELGRAPGRLAGGTERLRCRPAARMVEPILSLYTRPCLISVAGRAGRGRGGSEGGSWLVWTAGVAHCGDWTRLNGKIQHDYIDQAVLLCGGGGTAPTPAQPRPPHTPLPAASARCSAASFAAPGSPAPDLAEQFFPGCSTGPGQSHIIPLAESRKGSNFYINDRCQLGC